MNYLYCICICIIYRLWTKLKLALGMHFKQKTAGQCVFLGQVNIERTFHEFLVLLNLLNELGKRKKMRGLSSILSLFINKFHKFNNTRA